MPLHPRASLRFQWFESPSSWDVGLRRARGRRADRGEGELGRLGADDKREMRIPRTVPRRHLRRGPLEFEAPDRCRGRGLARGDILDSSSWAATRTRTRTLTLTSTSTSSTAGTSASASAEAILGREGVKSPPPGSGARQENDGVQRAACVSLSLRLRRRLRRYRSGADSSPEPLWLQATAEPPPPPSSSPATPGLPLPFLTQRPTLNLSGACKQLARPPRHTHRPWPYVAGLRTEPGPSQYSPLQHPPIQTRDPRSSGRNATLLFRVGSQSAPARARGAPSPRTELHHISNVCVWTPDTVP
ncbi:hypothetical protein C8Q79DRAFT_387691 [Trametes meyenii]|nr:hypothetical protein C8Q79DRAFT_387691 [Trametes meyenii]